MKGRCLVLGVVVAFVCNAAWAELMEQPMLRSNATNPARTNTTNPTTTVVPLSACPAACSGHGVACLVRAGVPTCQCAEGFRGVSCELPALSPRPDCPAHCSGHGICRAVDTAWQCECDDGFEGTDCGHVSATTGGCAPLHHCSGHGKCVGSADGLASSCECDVGFEGSDCSRPVHMCGGCRHGECVGEAPGAMFCKCTPGFAGPHCDLYVPTVDTCRAVGFCSGWGSCDFSLAPPQCQCVDGYGGATCSVLERSPCARACSGHGVCNDLSGVCECDVAYAEDGVCATPACPVGRNRTVCSGAGICTRTTNQTGTCHCDQGFKGRACEIHPCGSGCGEHGTCKVANDVGFCECDDMWTGEKCDVNVFQESDKPCCAGECSGHGVCSQCVCSCFDGFAGESCEREVVVEGEDDDLALPAH